MVRNRIIFLLGFVIILSGCSYKTTVSIDTLEPPTTTFINTKKPITVNYTYVNSGQLSKVLHQKNDFDSIAADAAAYIMASEVKSRSLFSQTNIVVTQTYRNDSLASKGFNLSSSDITNVILRTKSDAVLSLDYFSLNPEITVLPSPNGGYSAYLILETVALWLSYSPSTNKSTGEYLFKESYSWDANGPAMASAISNLPSLGEISQWVGSECGKKSASAFAPFWSTVNRYIFVNSDPKWIQARNLVKMGDWSSAAKIWSWQVGENKNPKKQWQAAYNLAVASEVQNDLLLALSWLDAADSFVSGSQEVKMYRETIQLRLKSQKILESYK